MNDISSWLNENNKSLKETALKPKQLVNLIKSIIEGEITGKIAKTHIDDLMRDIPFTPEKSISDRDELTRICKEIIKENDKIVIDTQENPRAYFL